NPNDVARALLDHRDVTRTATVTVTVTVDADTDWAAKIDETGGEPVEGCCGMIDFNEFDWGRLIAIIPRRSNHEQA
ncbi:hypothetical protein LCGC14_0583460, partial [marine sediment metagenome]